MQNLVRVSKAEGLPFKPQTFYKWYHLKKHSEIFVKFGGTLSWTWTDWPKRLKNHGSMRLRGRVCLTYTLTIWRT